VKASDTDRRSALGMAHSVCGQEEKDLEAYLTKIIPAVN
jgi:hypothetical protein